jgi:cytochrome c oxidase cbb3-type subunit 3
MATRFRVFAILGAGALLSSGLPASALAQSQDTAPPTHSLGAGEQSSLTQHPAETTTSEFLKVPMVDNIPGGIKPQENVTNPAGKDPSAAERGMQYFVSFNCVGCHAPNGAGGMGPALSSPIFFKYGTDPARLFLVISHGAPLGMPAWGNVLPDNVIWDLVAYVESISRAPQEQWGMTISPRLDQPAIEQVPAEFKQTPTPWQFTEPFGNGNPPSESGSGSAGMPMPSSGSSKQ